MNKKSTILHLQMFLIIFLLHLNKQPLLKILKLKKNKHLLQLNNLNQNNNHNQLTMLKQRFLIHQEIFLLLKRLFNLNFNKSQIQKRLQNLEKIRNQSLMHSQLLKYLKKALFQLMRQFLYLWLSQKLYKMFKM